MSRSLQIIIKPRSVAIYDGWCSRYFASTYNGAAGWYSCIRCPREGYYQAIALIAPPASRRKRPYHLYWRRGEVIAYFQNILRRARMIGRARQAREWKKTAFGR